MSNPAGAERPPSCQQAARVALRAADDRSPQGPGGARVRPV